MGRGEGGRASVRLGGAGPSNEDVTVLERAGLVRGEDQCGGQGGHGGFGGHRGDGGHVGHGGNRGHGGHGGQGAHGVYGDMKDMEDTEDMEIAEGKKEIMLIMLYYVVTTLPYGYCNIAYFWLGFWT